MNRKQFQEWLNQFPEDTEIDVIIQEESRGYESYGEAVVQKFEGKEEQFDFVDFTGNQFVKKEEPHFNKRYLTVGSSC